MKNLREIEEKCLLISDLCGSYELVAEREKKRYRGDADKLLNTANGSIAALGSELAAIKSECENEKLLRSECARRYIAMAADAVDTIDDKHFQRMKHKRLEENRSKTYLPDNFEAMGFNDLKQLIEASYRKLINSKEELETSFIPSSVSGIIGFFVPSVSKKLHSEIVVYHADIVRLAAVLNNFSHIKNVEKRAEGAEEALRKQIAENANDGAMKLKNGHDTELQKSRKVFKDVLKSDTVKRIFEESGGRYCFGKYHYFSREIGDVSDSLCGSARAIESGGLSFPVFADRIDSCILFSADKSSRLCNYFRSLALDVLEGNGNVRVRIFDIEGLGGTYSEFSELCGIADVEVVSTEAKATEFLCDIEKHIANVNAGRSAITDTFLFIENIPENIPERDAQLLLKIIKYGAKCGVYVIGSLKDGVEYPRAFYTFIKELCQSERLINIENCRINIGGGYLYLAVRDNSSERIERLKKRFTVSKKRSSVLSVKRTFPNEESFQCESSADGITVPIGIDENGAVTELVFSEKRPYALAIGDVASGKSSVLHSTLLGIMARYSPSEVNFAVGDFKNGCEFTSYAHSGCPHFEAVVSSEDIDTMASFLNYYISKMNDRQREFDKVSEKSGIPVRKYEVYRQECERLGIWYLPRILLVIDEFQTLFDNGSSGTGALLGELVRKGRTYGIHIFMASQRSISDNPRSSFGTELKNYFTTRIVFKCPQQAARSMLSERCADSGRENSGIAKAPRLECGHAVFNTYMGQNEEGNSVVQCFYSSDAVIADAAELFATLDKRRNVELIEGDCGSIAPKKADGYIMLGKSARLHRDRVSGTGDCIFDDGCVAIDKAKLGDSILVCGREKLALSVFAAALESTDSPRVNIYSKNRDRALNIAKMLCRDANVTDSISQIDISPSDEVTVNLIMCPEDDKELHQSSGYREVPGAEQFKKVLGFAEERKAINIIFCEDYKAARSCMPYLVEHAPIRFASVFDTESLRAVMGDSAPAFLDGCVEWKSHFPIYYCNKKSGKSGKFYLYHRDILEDKPLYQV